MLLEVRGQVGAVQHLAVQIGVDVHLRRGEGEVRHIGAQLGRGLFHQRGVERARHRQRERAPRAGCLAGLDRLVQRLALARDDQLAGAVVVDRTDQTALDRGAGLLDLGVVQTEDGGHAAVDRVRRLLHQLAAHGYDLDAVRERYHARRGERGIFAEREAGRCLERHARLGKRRERGHRVGEDRDLAVFRARKRLLIAVKAELRHIQTGALAGLFKDQTGGLRIVVKILAHARRLRALTGEKCKTVFHASFLQKSPSNLGKG